MQRVLGQGHLMMPSPVEVGHLESSTMDGLPFAAARLTAEEIIAKFRCDEASIDPGLQIR